MLKMYQSPTSISLALAWVIRIHAVPFQTLQSRDLATYQDIHAGIDHNACVFSICLRTLPSGTKQPQDVCQVRQQEGAAVQPFSTWYTAMAYAITQAGLAIAGIVSDVEPGKKASGLRDNILLALTVGLALLVGPEAALVR